MIELSGIGTCKNSAPLENRTKRRSAHSLRCLIDSICMLSRFCVFSPVAPSAELREDWCCDVPHTHAADDRESRFAEARRKCTSTCTAQNNTGPSVERFATAEDLEVMWPPLGRCFVWAKQKPADTRNQADLKHVAQCYTGSHGRNHKVETESYMIQSIAMWFVLTSPRYPAKRESSEATGKSRKIKTTHNKPEDRGQARTWTRDNNTQVGRPCSRDCQRPTCIRRSRTLDRTCWCYSSLVCVFV